MSEIFVSYRHGDQALVAPLMEMLERVAPAFFAARDLAPGEDLAQRLKRELDEARVLIVAIGPAWLEKPFSRTDSAFEEVQFALKKNLLVIPVLLGGVSMPAPDALPDTIRALAYRNAITLTPEALRAGAPVLTAAIEAALKDNRPSSARDAERAPTAAADKRAQQRDSQRPGRERAPARTSRRAEGSRFASARWGRRAAVWAIAAVGLGAGVLGLGGALFEEAAPAMTVVDVALVEGVERRAALDGSAAARVYEGDRLLGVVRSHAVPIVIARFSGDGSALLTVDRDGKRLRTDLEGLSRLSLFEREHRMAAGEIIWPASIRATHDEMQSALKVAGGGWRRATRWTRNRVFFGAWADLWFTPGTRFRDCDGCPEMMVLPAGEFLMGSPEDEPDRDADEGPQRVVSVARIALGVGEVTRDQFARFVRETGYDAGVGCFTLDEQGEYSDVGSATWLVPGIPQTDAHPAVCVSWEDAQAYVAWLNDQVGRHVYRLPSEAELEYAIRAGAGTPYPWGETADDACGLGNVADALAKRRFSGWSTFTCADGHLFTAPMGQFAANGFGLVDTSGNVWEWTEDCWNDTYEGAPTDGSAWTSGDCSLVVLRGGSWSNRPWNLRSAVRYGYQRTVRFNNVGFRVARTFTR